MQCKDVPDRPVLEFLAALNCRGATWFAYDPLPDNSVVAAMPSATPDKVVLGKMRMLKRRGLVSGCDCGCSGGFALTAKGKAWLEQERG